MIKRMRLTESDLHNIIESAVRKILKERVFSPEEYEDKAFMDDYWADREKSMENEWKRKNIAIRKKYPGKSNEWYEAMLDTFYENKANDKKSINEKKDMSGFEGTWDALDGLTNSFNEAVKHAVRSTISEMIDEESL